MVAGLVASEMPLIWPPRLGCLRCVDAGEANSDRLLPSETGIVSLSPTETTVAALALVVMQSASSNAAAALIASFPVLAAKAFKEHHPCRDQALVPRPVRPDRFLAGVEGLAGLGVGNRCYQHSCGQKDREAHQLVSRLIHCLVTSRTKGSSSPCRGI